MRQLRHWCSCQCVPAAPVLALPAHTQRQSTMLCVSWLDQPQCHGSFTWPLPPFPTSGVLSPLTALPASWNQWICPCAALALALADQLCMLQAWTAQHCAAAQGCGKLSRECGIHRCAHASAGGLCITIYIYSTSRKSKLGDAARMPLSGIFM